MCFFFFFSSNPTKFIYLTENRKDGFCSSDGESSSSSDLLLVTRRSERPLSPPPWVLVGKSKRCRRHIPQSPLLGSFFPGIDPDSDQTLGTCQRPEAALTDSLGLCCSNKTSMEDREWASSQETGPDWADAPRSRRQEVTPVGKHAGWAGNLGGLLRKIEASSALVDTRRTFRRCLNSGCHGNCTGSHR